MVPVAHMVVVMVVATAKASASTKVASAMMTSVTSSSVRHFSSFLSLLDGSYTRIYMALVTFYISL